MIVISVLCLGESGEIFYKRPKIPLGELLNIIPGIFLAVLLQILTVLTMNIILEKFGNILSIFSNTTANKLVQLGVMFFLIAMIEDLIIKTLEPVNLNINELFRKYKKTAYLINYYNSQSASQLRKDTHSLDKTELYLMRFIQHAIKIIVLLLSLPILIFMWIVYEKNKKPENPGSAPGSQNQPLTLKRFLGFFKNIKFKEHNNFFYFIGGSLLFCILVGVGVAFFNNSKTASSPVMENYHLKKYRQGFLPRINQLINQGKFTNMYIVNTLRPFIFLAGILAIVLAQSTLDKKYNIILWLILCNYLVPLCINVAKFTVFFRLYLKRMVKDQRPISIPRIREWRLYQQLTQKSNKIFLGKKHHNELREYFLSIFCDGIIPSSLKIIKINRNEITIKDFIQMCTQRTLDNSEILSILNKTDALSMIRDCNLDPLTTCLNNSALSQEILKNITIATGLAVDADNDLVFWGVDVGKQYLNRLRRMRRDFDSEVIIITEQEVS
jgi:hypothetical protein